MRNLKSVYSWELRKARALVKKIYGGKRKLEELPPALQRYFEQSGFAAHPKLHSVEVHWKDTFLKFSKNTNWKPINCEQYNFLPDPIRIVYMKAKLLGIIGIEAMDSFRHGSGNMCIKALNIINIGNYTGIEIDRSELVTILAETMIIPDYALYSYIHWEEIDLYTVRGTIDYHGLKASGIFYFNSNFEMVKFETNDRSLKTKKGIFVSTKWTATAADYHKKGGLKFPTSFTASWNLKDANFLYFKGKISSLKLNQ
ncbi:DUF6920 family protein [Pedobacter insulae]|uniref:Uncharacterized protein n=1 Tax=Pedobacter insulae TaxID=414048 RepID=A0A1I3A3W2_9SPHI|nr:DUF6544 family protein [Pedobacter insulae]SFH43991.1 hypothetical protein SAMN04489864_112101 [Pedobacter insulae]